MPHEFPWKTIASKVAYQHAWITMREDRVTTASGQESVYGVLTTHPSVLIVALNEKHEVYLAGQYRYPTQSFSWELPGGNTDNEEPIRAAQRELQEETGITAARWQPLGVLQAMNGISDEHVHTFLAQDLDISTIEPQLEEAIITLKAVPFPHLFHMIKVGDITDSQSIAAILQAALTLQIISLTE